MNTKTLEFFKTKIAINLIINYNKINGYSLNENPINYLEFSFKYSIA